jgi:hypothetical protein
MWPSMELHGLEASPAGFTGWTMPLALSSEGGSEGPCGGWT